MVLYLL